MKKLLDIERWARKDHFHFFRKFDEPFFGATVTVDCTKAYHSAKKIGIPFFVYYLHKVLVAVNAVEPFRYRIVGETVEVWDQIDASPTISHEDGSFAFSLVKFNPDIDTFAEIAKTEIERVRVTPGLFTRTFDDDNIIHFSALPWIDFTSLSHARSYSFPDSCPKISIGKMTDVNGKKTFPVSVHVHHGLMDGLHLGQFFDRFNEELNSCI
jgi:chloramphenicol O-acetyltransferase type A